MINDAAVLDQLDLWVGALLQVGSNLLALLGHAIGSAAVTGGTLLGALAGSITHDTVQFRTSWPSLSAVAAAIVAASMAIVYGPPLVGL